MENNPDKRNLLRKTKSLIAKSIGSLSIRSGTPENVTVNEQDNVIDLAERRAKTESSEEIVTVSFNSPLSLAEKARDAAETDGVTFTNFVKGAIADKLQIREMQKNGGKILLEKADGKIVELVWGRSEAEE